VKRDPSYGTVMMPSCDGWTFHMLKLAGLEATIRPSCGFPANNLEVLNILTHHVFYHDLPAFAFEVQTFISTWPEVFRKKIWFCQTYPSPSTRLSA